jgi:hypothetical protein
VLGEPLTCRLVTNGFSMSATGFLTERYMRLFVHWPVAMHPAPRHGLLISYGVGSTASALAREPAFRTIDVVDISRDVIEMADQCVRPHEVHPLEDPRVQVHIEDGRFFLLTTRRRFDLITAEPPPPGAAGIENLYSEEYFRLLHGKLADGGLATYWLPVHSLDRRGALSVMRAFCNVFDDCSLWNGGGLNWMLAGSRGGIQPVPESVFEGPWRDPIRRRGLVDIGLEEPEDLCGLFLGDAAFLAELSEGAESLVDDRPYRLATAEEVSRAESLRFFERVMDASAAQARFEASPWVARVFPDGPRRRAGPAFERIGIFNDRILPIYGSRPWPQLGLLHRALTQTTSYYLPLVILGSQAPEQRIAPRARARGERGAALDYLDGIRALAERDYVEAARRLEQVLDAEPNFGRAAALRALALCLAGDTRGFRDQVRPVADVTDAEFWAEVEPTCLKEPPDLPKS